MISQSTAELEADVNRLSAEMHQIRGTLYPDFPSGEVFRLANRKRAKGESSGRVKLEGKEALEATLLDTVEARLFIARRRLLLAQCAFDDDPTPAQFKVIQQPERLGVVVVAVFKDRLAAIDPKRLVDAEFSPDGGEIHRVFVAPKRMVARWLEARKASGNPWRASPEPTPEMLTAAAARRAKEEELYGKLRALMYPTRQDLKAARKEQSVFTPEEAKATLSALMARLVGEPPPIEEQIRTMPIENMSPLDAWEALRKLQYAARRRAEAKEFIPKSQGGTLRTDND